MAKLHVNVIHIVVGCELYKEGGNVLEERPLKLISRSNSQLTYLK